APASGPRCIADRSCNSGRAPQQTDADRISVVSRPPSSSRLPRPCNGVERLAEWPGRSPLTVAAQGSANCFGIGTVLNREREHDRAVPGVRVCLRVGFMIIQEQLAYAAIREPADRRGISEATNLDVEGRACAPVVKTESL